MRSRKLRLKPFDNGKTAETAPPLLSITWLGQAGFRLSVGDLDILVDPYLSDSLAKKYAGREFPHTRMMAPPVLPEEVRGIDVYLCTHRHTDHMDPATMLPVLANNPEAVLIVPSAWTGRVKNFGIDGNRIIGIDAGGTICRDDLQIEAIPSAHEELETDENGHHLYLGYFIGTGKWTVYHSGDCVPYPGLTEAVAAQRPDIALLPVNGRDEFRKSRGVPGNFTAEEAAALCEDASVPFFIPHHFGMFDFNTADPAEILRTAADRGEAGPDIIMPVPGVSIDFILENHSS